MKWNEIQSIMLPILCTVYLPIIENVYKYGARTKG